MSSTVPAWFYNAVVDGVQLLRALNLQGCPPADTVTLTAHAWIEVLWDTPVAWEETADAPRLAAAFLAVSRQAERWPAPRALLSHLPPRPETLRLAPPDGTRPTPDIAARLQKARLHFITRKAQK